MRSSETLPQACKRCAGAIRMLIKSLTKLARETLSKSVVRKENNATAPLPPTLVMAKPQTLLR